MNETPETTSQAIDPLSLISARRPIAIAILLFGVSGWIAGLYMNHRTVSVMRRDTLIQSLDDNGNVVLSNGAIFEKAKFYHEYCARIAIEAALSWNPNGLNYPERFELCFPPGFAKSYVDEMWSLSKDEFAKRQFHQAVEILSIKTVSGQKLTDPRTNREYDVVQVFAEVQLLREGVANGVTFTDPQFGKISMRMVRNPSVGSNKLMPIIAQNFKYEPEQQP
jgi:hypothetical protein